MLAEGYLEFLCYLVLCYPVSILLRNFSHDKNGVLRIPLFLLFFICIAIGNISIMLLFGIRALLLYYLSLSLPMAVVFATAFGDHSSFLFKTSKGFGSLLGSIWCLGIVFLYHLSTWTSGMGGKSMDASAILMMLSIKLTGLINDSCDGLVKFPTFMGALLEVTSYAFLFTGMSSGPLCRFEYFRRQILAPYRGEVKLYTFKLHHLVPHSFSINDGIRKLKENFSFMNPL